MADVRELAQQIQRSRDIALKFAGQSSDKHLIKLLVKAHNDLNQQIGEHARMGRSEQFTAVHAQAVMAQLKSVMMPLTRGLSSLVVDTTSKVAKASAQQAIDYVKMAEDTFHGIGAASALQLHEAMIVDRVANGVRASQMRRLATSGEAGSDLQGVAPGKAGIIQRYGMNVVGKFEEVLQQRYLTRKPWGEVRDELVAQSPFLTGKEPGVATTWAERILRTETMYASNAANKECMVDMNQSLGDMVNILCATFDERTGSDSYAVHGQIRRLNEPFQSWFGSYMHPPNRPNDREIVVAHRMSWPLPPTFTPKTEGEVANRWKAEGRKGAPPSRPNMSTIPRDQFGKRAEQPPPPAPPPDQPPPPQPPPDQPPKPLPPKATPAKRTPRASRPLPVAPATIAGVATQMVNQPITEPITGGIERHPNSMTTAPKPHHFAAHHVSALMPTHGEGAHAIAHGMAMVERGLDMKIEVVIDKLKSLATDSKNPTGTIAGRSPMVKIADELVADGWTGNLRSHLERSQRSGASPELLAQIKAAAAIASHLETIDMRATRQSFRKPPEGDAKPRTRELTNHISYAEDLVHKMTDASVNLSPRGGMPSLRIISERSHYNTNKIGLESHCAYPTIIHEVAHSIEHGNDAVTTRAIEFLHNRTAGEKAIKLRDFTGRNYDNNEVAKPDKFINAYVGKIYRSRATEVLSMGFEHLVKDPVNFMMKDPDHFALTLGALSKR